MTATLIKATAEWVEWINNLPPALTEAITQVSIRPRELGQLGYDIHISAYEVDQDTVDGFAEALGVQTDKGWNPPGYDVPHRQWSLTADRNGLQWAITATSHDPARK